MILPYKDWLRSIIKALPVIILLHIIGAITFACTHDIADKVLPAPAPSASIQIQSPPPIKVKPDWDDFFNEFDDLE
jgi:hypothetical protein